MPSWTKDQSLAIDKRGGKIIVSAAAGSGKTAVLSQRVINYVLSGGYIDRLLIVTFTKAAATEMKGRIKEKINDAYLNDENNEHLKKQLQLVDSAMITTMDAFYSDIVKDNFEKIGIDKNFEILSNEEDRILKEKIIKKVLENGFDNVPEYTNMLSFFGGYGLEQVKKAIFKISSFLDTLPFKNDFIKKAINNYDKENDYYKELFLKQVRDKMKSLDLIYGEIIEEMYDASSDFDKIMDTLRKEKNYINSFLTVSNFDELSYLIRKIEFDTLRTPKGHKDDEVIVRFKIIREDFKNEIRKNLNELAFITEESYEKEKRLVKNASMTLFKVIKIYEEELLKEKMLINSFTFSDVAHFVIDLLIKDGEKTYLSNDLSQRFDEILIDEYQDTNNLQNVIFNAISKNNENLFIVGDVKQSIYRFRSACPEIFNKDKEEASKDSFPNLITLSKNFRSRVEVLDFCNFIFENTMSKNFGEVNYDKNERLYLGASFKDGNNLETEISIIDGMEKSESDEEDLTKVQKEAIYVAEKIKSLLDNDYQVYDNKKQEKRKIRPSDIVILLRSLKNASYYSYALNKRGISSYLESSNEYFDNYEIKLIINILKVIDNPYDDVALMSILNSSITSISLDEVANLRSKNKYVSLYESLKDGSEKINEVFNKIKHLREYSNNHKLYKLLNEVYKTFDVVFVVSALKGGQVREKNLMQMLNHASNFDTKNISLHEFISYLESVILGKGSLEGVNPLSEGDNVLITTIHKSKGLEYPVVILSETGKNFNFSDVRSDVMINDDLGVSFNIKDDDYKLKYESVPMMVFKEHEKSKMLSEELRILYVALTRAKEKIIITGYTNNLESLVTKVASKIGDKEIISSLYLKGVKNYFDIIVACLLRHPSCKDLRSLSMVIPKSFATPSKVKVNVISAVNINEDEFNQKSIIEKRNFDAEWFNKISTFNNENNNPIPVYLSVSDIKKKSNYLRLPNFMSDGIDHTSVGTLYHKIFEVLPVKKYDVNSLKDELEKLLKDNIITKEELSIIKLENIFSYLTSEIYDGILSSDKIYREKELTFEVPASYYDKTLKSGKILTSGIVDLMFVKDGVYTIVDYKTDNVDTLEELKDRYKVQLDLYEIGIKNIMKAKSVKKYIYSVKLNNYIEV